MIKGYYWYYIAYEDLKKALKTDYVSEPTPENPRPERKPWTEDDEHNFVSLLESELDKVFTFQRVKSDEIVRRIQASEVDVTEVISHLEHSSASNPAPSDEDFLYLEQILSDIIADVHDLAKFTQLNYTGFQKIIKKHDVRCSHLACRIGKTAVPPGLLAYVIYYFIYADVQFFPPCRKKRGGISNQFLQRVSMRSPSSRTITMLLW